MDSCEQFCFFQGSCLSSFRRPFIQRGAEKAERTPPRASSRCSPFVTFAVFLSLLFVLSCLNVSSPRHASPSRTRLRAPLRTPKLSSPRKPTLCPCPRLTAACVHISAIPFTSFTDVFKNQQPPVTCIYVPFVFSKCSALQPPQRRLLEDGYRLVLSENAPRLGLADCFFRCHLTRFSVPRVSCRLEVESRGMMAFGVTLFCKNACKRGDGLLLCH